MFLVGVLSAWQWEEVDVFGWSTRGKHWTALLETRTQLPSLCSSSFALFSWPPSSTSVLTSLYFITVNTCDLGFCASGYEHCYRLTYNILFYLLWIFISFSFFFTILFFYAWFHFLGAFGKFRKVTIGFVMSVRLFARNNSARSALTFVKFWTCIYYSKICRENSTYVKSFNQQRYSTWRTNYIHYHISLSSSQNYKCFRQKKIVQKIKRQVTSIKRNLTIKQNT
jgi:hypothetical protein